MHGSANSSSTEWETDSESEPDSQSPHKPSTPLARVDTLRPISGGGGTNTANAKSQAVQKKSQPQTTEAQPQRRPQKPTRTSRPPSSLSTKSTSSVHPLLGLHSYASATSTSTTSTSSPINMASHHFPPLTATLSHHSKQDPHHLHHHEDSQLTPIPIPSLSRPRTTSTLSSPSSAALSSLAHIPTRPPSPYAPYPPYLSHQSYSSYASASSTPPSTSNFISFFPPANPLLSLESIHPLLPSPFLGNHLTVLAKRAPMRESLERVRSAKARADAASGGR